MSYLPFFFFLLLLHYLEWPAVVLRGIPVLIPILGSVQSFTSKYMLAVGILYVYFIGLRTVSFIEWINIELHQMFSSASSEMTCFSFFNLLIWLYWFLNIERAFHFQNKNRILPFLHTAGLTLLTCLKDFCVCVREGYRSVVLFSCLWFGFLGNVSLINWVGKYPPNFFTVEEILQIFYYFWLKLGFTSETFLNWDSPAKLSRSGVFFEGFQLHI